MKKLIATLCITASLLTLAGPLAARPDAGPGGSGSGDDFRHLEFIADQLGLSDDQEEQINQIISASQLENAVDRERARQIGEEMKAQVSSFDAGTVQALADELGAITSRLSYSATETHAAIHQLFTAEQQAQLEGLRLQREQHRGEHRGELEGLPRSR
jgi:Spy/CpxP family protein refolding chaperone